MCHLRFRGWISVVASAAALGAAARLAADEPKPAPPPGAPAAYDQAAPAQPQPEPFAFADWTWLNGNPRTTSSILDTKYFTGEFRVDVNYVYDFNQPKDHTIDGSTRGRSVAAKSSSSSSASAATSTDENVRARLMTQFGMYSHDDAAQRRQPRRAASGISTTPTGTSPRRTAATTSTPCTASTSTPASSCRTSASSATTTSTTGRISRRTSRRTRPWFFNGIRIQIFPSDKLKIEPWIINGWQSYGMFNSRPGSGARSSGARTGNVSLVFNNYCRHGHAEQSGPPAPAHRRQHPGQVPRPAEVVSLEGRVLPHVRRGLRERRRRELQRRHADDPAQYFIGFMVYNRFWFANDKFAVTVGGGAINNPGRYLVLLPPDQRRDRDVGDLRTSRRTRAIRTRRGTVRRRSTTCPSSAITFRAEFNHRGANVPYFTGAGGITPHGGNQGTPGSVVDGFTPDLRKAENRINTAILVKF